MGENHAVDFPQTLQIPRGEVGGFRVGVFLADQLLNQRQRFRVLGVVRVLRVCSVGSVARNLLCRWLVAVGLGAVKPRPSPVFILQIVLLIILQIVVAVVFVFDSRVEISVSNTLRIILKIVGLLRIVVLFIGRLQILKFGFLLMSGLGQVFSRILLRAGKRLEIVFPRVLVLLRQHLHCLLQPLLLAFGLQLFILERKDVAVADSELVRLSGWLLLGQTSGDGLGNLRVCGGVAVFDEGPFALEQASGAAEDIAGRPGRQIGFEKVGGEIGVEAELGQRDGFAKLLAEVLRVGKHFRVGLFGSWKH